MRRISITAFLLAALLCVPAARSQSTSNQSGTTATQPEQPISGSTAAPSGSSNGSGAAPAGRAIFGGGDASQDEDQTQALPLSGAEKLVIPGSQTNDFFDASALATVSGYSDVTNAQGQQVLGASEIVGGQLLFDRTWKDNHFSLAYTGGGTFFEPDALYPAAMYQTLSLAQSFGWKRWNLRLMDQFSYSPNSLFGGAGIGGPGLLSETELGTSFNPAYSSTNTILTSQTRILNNSAVVEIQYNLSRRSYFTANGSAELLDYLKGGYIDSHEYVGGAGYNYMLSPKDTLAVTYTFNQTHYVGTPQSLNVQQINLAYSRQVSGRLVFQVSAGPELLTFHDYTPSAGDSISWDLNAGLQYRMRRSSFGLSYSRGANAGSGLYLGSSTQYVTGSVSRQFSRTLVGVLSLGYSRNGSLANVPGVSNLYQNYFAGVSLGRQIGQYSHLSFNYGAFQQPTGGICPVTAGCGTTRVYQSFGVALDLHIHRIGFAE
jgi:hypothetical protein